MPRKYRGAFARAVVIATLLAASGCLTPPAAQKPPARAEEQPSKPATLPQGGAPPPLPGSVRRGPQLRKRGGGDEHAPTADLSAGDKATAEAPEMQAKPQTPPPDPPGEELALLIAQRIADGAQGNAPQLPPPHDPNETNNLFSLVRTADDLSAELPTYALSDNGKKIAFVRNEDLSLWMASAQGTQARKVFTANKDLHLSWNGQEDVLHTSGIFDLEFSPGGQILYFQTDLAATSLGLQMYDERTKRVQTVTSANGYVVIKGCERNPGMNGYIIAYRHDYSVRVATATDLYFLLGPRGEPLGPIGPEPENVARFLHNECGQGKPVAPAQNETVPLEMRRTIPCNGVAYRYLPLRFLDGSVWQLFYAVKGDKATVPQGDLQLDDYESLAMDLEEATDSLTRCQSGE